MKKDTYLNVLILDDFPRIALNVADAVEQTFSQLDLQNLNYKLRLHICYTYEQAVYKLARFPAIDLFITDYIILPRSMISDRLDREYAILDEKLAQLNPNDQKYEVVVTRMLQIFEDKNIIDKITPIGMSHFRKLEALMRTTKLEEDLVNSAKLSQVLTTRLLIAHTLRLAIPTIVLSGDSFEEMLLRRELRLDTDEDSKGINEFVFTNKIKLNLFPQTIAQELNLYKVLQDSLKTKYLRELGVPRENPYAEITKPLGLDNYIRELRAIINKDDAEISNSETYT